MYRELLQNSNDACATHAEVRFHTSRDERGVVEGVVYRNNGKYFSDADLSRLTCIAAGNPDPEKIGAFGVGAYSLFSICSNPLLLSGPRSLLFEWEGDSLVAKHGPRPSPAAEDAWTTFELPAREPYSLPDLVDFGSFLASALAFTTSLASAEVFVNDVSVLAISKHFPAAPVVMKPPVANSWWSRNSIILNSPTSLFSLAAKDASLTDAALQITARYGRPGGGGAAATETLSARIISADVAVDCSPAMRRRMERVTKKHPMDRFPLRLLLGDTSELSSSAEEGRGGANRQRARAMLEQFAPRLGAGQLYIGFRTSQTTGMAVATTGPFIPTVEREALDLQDPTLAIWNGELLFMAGVLMRLSLEHGLMDRIGALWKDEAAQRGELERLRMERIGRTVESGKSGARPAEGSRSAPAEGKSAKSGGASDLAPSEDGSAAAAVEAGKKGGVFAGFASFMSAARSEVKRIAVSVVESVSDDPSNLLTPPDPQPVPSNAEREAIVLMRSFVPARSTPDTRVGASIAKGFVECLPNLAPPMLTSAGVVRGSEAFTANLGMEGFLAFGSETETAGQPLVRSVVRANTADYVEHVCRVKPLTIERLATHLKSRLLTEDEALVLISWAMLYVRKQGHARECVEILKSSVTVLFGGTDASRLRDFLYFASSKNMGNVPLQPEVLPVSFSSRLPDRVLRDSSFSAWFAPLSWVVWSDWILEHESLTAERSPAADAKRLAVLSCLAGEVFSAQEGMGGGDSGKFLSRLKGTLGIRKCLPIEGGGLERPVDAYLPVGELETFSGVALAKVCASVLSAPHVSERFLIALGVREAVSLDVLFTELDRLTWTTDPTGLVHYLCSRSKLSRSEIQRLRESQFLPSTLDQDLHAPSELVLPLPELKGFPFIPFLRWRGSLSSGSKTAVFLSETLGMRSAPTLESILRVASDEKTTPTIRRKCVEFAAARLDAGAAGNDFRSQLRDKPSLLTDIPFLPSQRIQPVPGWVLEGGVDLTSKLCAPKACFSDRSCSVAGFWVVDSEFEISASRFKVEREPSSEQYIRALLRIVGAALAASLVDCDEKRHSLVWRLFEFFASRIRRFSSSDKQILGGIAFVPIWVSSSDSDDDRSLVWRRPGDVYFESGSSSKSSFTSCLFDTVAANDFLRFAGVKDEPTLSDLCDLIVLNPENVFSKMGYNRNRYGELLQRVSSQLSSQSQAHGTTNALLNQLKRTPFLLATKFVDESSGVAGAQESGEEADQTRASVEGEAVAVQKVTWVLAVPADVFIIDDTLLQRMFNPLSLPSDLNSLESFYRQLGASFLSTAVSRLCEIPRMRQAPSETEIARELKNRILQRRVLILETSNRALSNGAASMLSADSLFVRQVSQISSVCVLKGSRKVHPVTCCSNHGLSGRVPSSSNIPSGVKLILYVTDDVDFFDVADALGRRIYGRCGLQDIFLLAQLLETTLAQLRARGFPVDKILSAAPVPPAPSSQAEKPQAEESAQTESRAPLKDSTRAQAGSSTSVAENGKRSSNGYDKLPSSDTPSLPENQSQPQSQPQPPEKPKSEGSKNFPRALMKAFKKRSAGISGTGGLETGGSGTTLPDSATGFGGTAPETVPDDARSRNGTRSALNSAVKAAATVPASGVSSPETRLVEVPPSSQASSCEVIPGQSLAAVTRGDQKAKTSHGHRVFVSRLGDMTEESLIFCKDNWTTVERFSYLLNDLANIFRLDAGTVAIFYAKGGSVIAFNSNGSLFFNLRYFAKLHENGQRVPSVDAWIFWYTTCCHELAHNLSRPHDVKHGYYTESFSIEFFPRFLSRLRAVGL